MRRTAAWLGGGLLLACLVGTQVWAAGDQGKDDLGRFKDAIVRMKQTPRGPFERIRWFCKDGTVLPPKAYACGDHGGGVQHGEWTEEVQAMREAGLMVGNLLVEVDPATLTGANPDLDALSQILLERFLVTADDGWIFRGARNYRGAFQIEDEEKASQELLTKMLADKGWQQRFFLLRETARLLPRPSSSPTAALVRGLATEIHVADPSFEPLRAKIHGFPDQDDAQAVREYAAKGGKEEVKEKYETLAAAIDSLYSEVGLSQQLSDLSGKVRDGANKALLAEGLKSLKKAQGGERFAVISDLLAQLREGLARESRRSARLAILFTGLELERAAYTRGNQLLTTLGKASRLARLQWLHSAAKALYGSGLLSRRQLASVEDSIARLTANSIDKTLYRREVLYLARVMGWADRGIAFSFKDGMDRLQQVEPLVSYYPQDRLRGSPLLFYGAVADSLVLDANRLANLEHRFFGKSMGTGLRALNPGFARGVLRVPDEKGRVTDSQGIYLLPETVSDLPPVAGILTRGEGNSLSHIQLLARNLAIPNAVVDENRVADLMPWVGKSVVMTVSADGVVELSEDSAQWDKLFKKESKEASLPSQSLVIRPDLDKLDLSVSRLIPLSELRASDSGRLAGPKSANLGELTYLFGDAVPQGFVIPFGTFRELLNRPLTPGGPAVFDWMKDNYREIAALPEGSPARQAKVAQFLSRLRGWIEESPANDAFEKELRAALKTHFGADGSFGVFVRSDTNVEDLPGFTGAGLNLTVANVVGYGKITKAVREVWASPFTERAFAWRQSHMEQPEYVFPAVLVQLSFPSEKSGVMVTKDVEWGLPGRITVAVNEGVGGAVDGQAAESLSIDLASGQARLLSQATASKRRMVDVDGGLKKVAASGADAVLSQEEINQLVALARQIPEKFPSLKDEHGRPMPADVEFGFKGGRLALLQIRPLVEAKLAHRLGFIPKAGQEGTAVDERVDLNQIPAGDGV